MIIKICNDVVSISDDEFLNTKNYIDALKYMKNLHIFISLLNEVIDIRKVRFLSSFKGETVIKQLNLVSENEKEQKMEIFKITSDHFFGDLKLVDKIKDHMSKICESIIYDKGVLTFIIDDMKIKKYKKTKTHL